MDTYFAPEWRAVSGRLRANDCESAFGLSSAGPTDVPESVVNTATDQNNHAIGAMPRTNIRPASAGYHSLGTGKETISHTRERIAEASIFERLSQDLRGQV